MTPTKFRATVWRYYRAQGRHNLPWRHTRDLYHILVSEVMLQQTQVHRVLPMYAKFTRRFSTAKKLAQAPLSEVLKSWQGLGYNRRAKMLHQAAKELAATRFDLVTRSNLVAELEKLPGIGPYTARAIAAFAYKQDVIFIETNIRTAVTHHFFPKKKKVSDTEIEKILTHVFPKGRAREWYSALMDYGAYLKRSGISYNSRGEKHMRQPKFVGSLREARGAVLRTFTRGVTSRARLINLLGPSRRVQMEKALKALLAEGLINGNLLSTASRSRRPRR